MRRDVSESTVKARVADYYRTGVCDNLETMNRYIREVKRRFPEWFAQFNDIEKPKDPTNPNREGVTQRTEKEDGSIEMVLLSAKKLRTKEEMAEFCNIDLNEFYAEKITSNTYGSESAPCWQFKVWWRLRYKKDELSPKRAIELFENMVERIKVPQFLKKIGTGDSDFFTEVQIPDLHMGQLSWGSELGAGEEGNYDIKIAREEYIKAVSYYCNLYADNPPLEFIFPIGNDLFNVSSGDNRTMNGTLQDEDDRAEKTFEYAFETCVEAVRMLAQIAPVRMVHIPGNHDGERISYLMVGLKYYFKRHPQVILEEELLNPSGRKYIQLGNTLLGLSHGKLRGKVIKMDQYPIIMADEVPDLWARTKYREFHIGHIHHSKIINSSLVDEFRGVVVRAVGALAKLDKWHYDSGYRATRQAQAFDYHIERGLTSINLYNAD